MTTKLTRIVLVDDHLMFRDGLAEVLSRESDLEICGTAEDCDQALETIKTNHPDLVIVDLSLKNSNGIGLIKAMHGCCSKVAILVLSMHEESIFAERALRAGADAYITKQQAIEHLIAVIRKIQAGESVSHDSITRTTLNGAISGDRCRIDRSIKKLSDRELDVLGLIGKGLDNHQIASQLHIDSTTVATYRARIKEKLDLKDATELLQFGIRWVHRDPIKGPRQKEYKR